ncbi:MAG: hypothetical protein N2B04_00105 [Psychrobacter sp.]
MKNTSNDISNISNLLVNKDFMSKYKLLDKNARKHLRPLVFDNLDKPYNKINKLRKLLRPVDIVNIEDVILLCDDNEVIPDLFPKEPRILQKEYFLDSIPIDKHLNILNLVVKNNIDKLTALIKTLLELNDFILSKEYLEAERLIEVVIDNYGYSHFIIRKIILVSELSKLEEVELIFIDEFVQKFNSYGENQILSSLQQCYDVEMSFFSLKKSVMNISGFECYLNTILKIPFLYKDYNYKKNDLDMSLRYNLQSSLIDGLLFLVRNSEIYAYQDYHYLKLVLKLFEESRVDIEDLAAFYLENFSIDTEDIFSKHSSAWYEIEGIGNYRVLQDLFVDDPNSDYLDLAINIENLYSNLHAVINKYNLSNLLDPSMRTNSFKSNLELIMNDGAITRSAIFNYTVALNKGEISFDQHGLYWIMGNTRELARSIDYKLLRKIAKESDNLESKIIYYLLIHKKSENELDNHNLRKFLSKVILDDFDGDLISFIEYQYGKSEVVANFIYETCTVDFISKLTHIIKDTVSITDTRAKLHIWMWEKTSDKNYFERARTILIDHQINKIRNELHDNRIYVDAQRFNDWISDEIIREFTSVLSSIEKIGLTEYYESPQLFYLVDKVYQEFCNNNIYGISSYLGRRIRHGTFKGTMYKNIVSFMEQKYNIDEQSHIVGWKEWKEKYESRIEQIIDTYLHVKSDVKPKKPKGLIDPETTAIEKKVIVQSCIKDLMKIFFEQGSNINLNNILIEYCWRLIEVDLKNVNQYLKSTQSEVLQFTKPPQVAYNQESLNIFFKDLQVKVRDSFSIVFEWFKRPQSVAPKAEIVLLVRAVIEEVKESHNLKFNDQKLLSEFVLFGGAYHVIYDALYVIIFNAAKHGDSSKPLEIVINFDNNSRKLFISIASHIYSNQNEELIIQRLKVPSNADISNAQLYEGRSGIMKLHHLEQTDGNFSIEKIACLDNKVMFTISYKVANNV